MRLTGHKPQKAWLGGAALWLGTTLAGGALSQEPEWLSETLGPRAPAAQTTLGTDAEHGTGVITRRSSQTLTAPSGISTESITTTPLGSEQADAIGILSPEQTGISPDFWGDSDAATVARLVRPFYPAALPEITALWQRIALAEINAPNARDGGGEILLARVDHLLNAGALDQAEALLNLVQRPSPALFRRAFDVGLLTGRSEAACASMLGNASLTPNMKARVFCLAREGDWAAAAITLRTAQALREIKPADAALLGRFLDPEEFENDPPPPPPKPLTAMDFTMRETLALPRSGQALPLAFSHADLTELSPWRDRVIATERLVRAQAIPAADLIELYQEGTPAASGGIWVRVAAVQALLRAVRRQDGAAASKALKAAYDALGQAGLTFALADLSAGALRDMTLDPQAEALRFRLWLLHKDYRSLVFDYDPQSRQDRFLAAIANGRLEGETPRGDLEAAIAAAFAGRTPDNTTLWQARQGRLGEAVLKSLTTLVRSRHADPVAVETTLSVLLMAGLRDEARRIALQIVMRTPGRI